jgi:ankyrin repeat protein
LIYAANAGSDESVRILLANGARTDAKMRDGTTALFYGVMSGNHIVTNLIVARSSPATINAKQTNGDNALIRAVKLGNLNVIDSILNGNPALEEKDQFGQTALMNAARKGLTRAAIHLLRKGANPNARDNNSITALTKATIGKHRATQQVLRAAGGRP